MALPQFYGRTVRLGNRQSGCAAAITTVDFAVGDDRMRKIDGNLATGNLFRLNRGRYVYLLQKEGCSPSVAPAERFGGQHLLIDHHAFGRRQFDRTEGPFERTHYSYCDCRLQIG